VNLLAVMNKKIAILLNCLLISIISALGQCPDKDFLWERVSYLNSSKIPQQKKLTELLNYLNEMNGCPYKNDSTHELLLSSIANIYSEQGDYLKEIQYRQQAIDIISANASRPSVKIRILPGRYYWQSVAYDSLNNATERRKALDSCITTSMRLKYVDRSTLTAFESRVEIFFDVGDYQPCIDYSEIWESLGRKYANNTTGLEHIVGERSVYSSIGWRVKALLELRKFQTAEELLKDKLEEYRKAGLKNYVAMIYGLMAGVQDQRGEYDKALSYFNLSLKYYQGIKDYLNCKQVTKDIGGLYFRRLGDREKALVFFKKALTYTYIDNDELHKLKDAPESLDIFSNIADIYSSKGLYDLAHYYFQLAFDQIRPGINETGILNSSSEEIKKVKKIHYLTALIIDKGDAYRRQFHVTKDPRALAEAIRIYKVADQFLNKIKAEQTDVQSKLFWRSDSRRVYENAIEASYLQKNLADAFYFFEKSRAVLLQDQLNEQRWSGQNNILEQTQLEKKIQQLEKQQSAAGIALSDSSSLQNDIFNSKQELARLREVIRANAPLYYQSFLDTASLSTADVKHRILKDHHALVELFTGDSAIYVLAITQQNSFLRKINKADFDRLSDAYRNFISNPGLLNTRFDAFKDVSLHLYQLIFQNINLPAGRIIISPDAKYFPFESLITSAKPLTYFLEDHAVSYTYSARYLLNDFTTNASSYTFMGFAPVQYSDGMPALPGSDASLTRIENYFRNVTNFVGKGASRNNFLSGYYKYKILQLYTHATDGGSAGEPLIYFSDSVLSLSDLFYERKPSTSLIVLSACETANGKLYNGEGIFSFSRQFAALGIPSSISNLWKVDNVSTYQVTELFYKYLAKGLPLDVALQKAKKEFKTISSREKGLPYYWAASILIGQADAIRIQKSFPWMSVGMIAIIMLLGLGGFTLIRRRRFNPGAKVNPRY
jgi:CHAT domain-containing protein